MVIALDGFPEMQKIAEIQPKFLLLKNHYTEQSFISNTQHTADLAMLTAKQRYYKFVKENKDMVNRIPQYYIAAYLGIKPQSPSRIRNHLLNRFFTNVNAPHFKRFYFCLVIFS